MSTTQIHTTLTPAAGFSVVTLTSYEGDAVFNPAPVIDGSGGGASDQIYHSDNLEVAADGTMTGADGVYRVILLRVSGSAEGVEYRIGYGKVTINSTLSPPAGWVVATLEADFDPYVFQQWLEADQPVVGDQVGCDEQEAVWYANGRLDAHVESGNIHTVLWRQSGTADGFNVDSAELLEYQNDPPTGDVTFGTAQTTTDSISQPYSYSASDAEGFEQRIDGGAWESSTSPVTVSNLSYGESVTIEIRPYNYLGTGTVASITTSADEQPLPKGTVVMGATHKTDTTIDQYFSYTETDHDGFQQSIDSGLWETTTNPVKLINLTPETPYNIRVRAYNQGGGGASTEIEVTTASDIVAPTGTVTMGTATLTTNSISVPYTYSGTDPTGFQERIDGGTWASSTSPVELSNLNEGQSVVIEVRAVNSAGGGTITSTTLTTEVSEADPLAPQGEVSFGSPTVGTTSISQPFSYLFADHTGFQRRINSGSWSSTVSPVTLSDLEPDTPIRIDVRAVNAVGPGSTYTTTVSTLDASAPQDTVNIGTITLGWDTATVPFTYSGDDATGYEYKLGSNSWQEAHSPLEVGGLIPGTDISLAIRALNDGGSGQPESTIIELPKIPLGIQQVDDDDIIYPGQTFDIIIGMPPTEPGQMLRVFIRLGTERHFLVVNGLNRHRLNVRAPSTIPLFALSEGIMVVEVVESV